jgi:uncharacterized protein (TIGR03086 family)
MSEISDRYERVAAVFTARVQAVPPDSWDNPTPCDGWVARDVVRHLVEWVPGFCTAFYEVDLGTIPSVDDDPVAAWVALDRGLSQALTDEAVAGTERDTPMGRKRFDDALDMVCTGDVLVHTWDLARATGQDDRLDPQVVHDMVGGMEAMDVDAMRSSGHFGPRVEVPEDAGEQDRLLAFMGRDPGVTPRG